MSKCPILLEIPSGRVIPIGDISEVSIGRAQESTVNILSTFVSRNQCVITKTANDESMLHDKSRFKSTLLNGRAVPEEGHILQTNDKISFVYFKDIAYEFHSDYMGDMNPCKKRRTVLETEEVNDVIPTQSGSGPLELISEVESLRKQLESKEAELAELRKQNTNSQQEQSHFPSLGFTNKEEAQLFDDINSDLKNGCDVLYETSKIMDEMREFKEKLLEAEIEIERILTECHCRLNSESNFCKSHSPAPPAPELPVTTGDSPSPIPGEDPFLPPIEEDFESPHCTINGKIIMDDDLDGKSDKCPVIKGIMDVELDYMRTTVEDTKTQLINTKALLESVKTEKENLIKVFGDIVDIELVCSICSDIILEAVSLNCKHTFCKACIDEWKKKKKDCPVCRTRIKAEVSPLLVDSFIDKVVGLIGGELEQKRNDLKVERQKAAEEEKKQATSKKRKAPSFRHDDVVYGVIGSDDTFFFSNEGNHVLVLAHGLLSDPMLSIEDLTAEPDIDMPAYVNQHRQPRGRRRRSRRY